MPMAQDHQRDPGCPGDDEVDEFPPFRRLIRGVLLFFFFRRVRASFGGKARFGDGGKDLFVGSFPRNGQFGGGEVDVGVPAAGEFPDGLHFAQHRSLRSALYRQYRRLTQTDRCAQCRTRSSYGKIPTVEN